MKNIIFLLIFSTSLSFGAKKAFVVGNGDYSNSSFSTLASSVNDAVQVSAKLKQLGYKVTTVKNGTKTTFEDSLYAFSAKLTSSDTALFFFAGHGVEYNNSNYLIPSNPNIACSDNIRSRSIPLDEVVSEFTAKGCRFNLFFIDACRSNYVKSCDGTARGELETRGIAIQQNSLKSTNTAYIYASQSGEKAYGSASTTGNGLFTSALLKYLGTPGDDISDLYRKVNNEVDSVSNSVQVADLKISQLKEKFFFVPPLITQAKQDTVLKVVTSDDYDNDGLSDNIDRCPDVAGTVEEMGCPVTDMTWQPSVTPAQPVSVVKGAPRASIAIANLEHIGVTEEEAAVISLKIRNELINSGQYSVMESSEMITILNEQGYKTNSNKIEMGMLLGVKYVLAGTVAKIGNTFYIETQLLDIATGLINLSIGTQPAKTIQSVLTIEIPQLAQRLAQPSTNDIKRAALAIAPLDNKGLTEQETAILHMKLLGELSRNGRYSVMDNSEMISILNEQAFDTKGSITSASATEIGQLLGVRYVVTGSVGKLENSYYIGTQLVDIVTGQTIRGVQSQLSKTFDNAFTIEIPKLAKELSLGLSSSTTTQSEVKAIPNASLSLVQNNELFPVYGLTPGRSSKEMVKSIADSRYFMDCYKKNDLLLFIREGVLNYCYLNPIKEENIPPNWKTLGFNADLTKDQWESLMQRLGYKISDVKEPHIEYGERGPFCKASFTAVKQTGTPTQVEFSFISSGDRLIMNDKEPFIRVLAPR